MHQILTLIGTSVIQIEQNWHQNIQHITALQHIEQELLEHRDEETSKSELYRYINVADGKVFKTHM